MPTAVNITYSGNPDIDGLLIGTAWSTSALTYSFPTSGSLYGANYEGGTGQNTQGFAQLNAAQQATVAAVLANYSQVSNLQFTQVTETTSQHAVLREAQSSQPFTADSYYPGTNYTSPSSSDSWYGNSHSWLQNPVVGSYGYYVFLHEIGLALGLKDDTTGTDLPEAHDAMEYSVESYRSYVDATVSNGLHNEAGSYAQSLMIDDIAAIQYLYGANFSAIGTSVTYSWDPSTGQEFINGVGQGVPTENKIFTTIWDQGATATYDLSDYATNLVIDLRPGHWSTFSSAQLAEVGDDANGIVFADGNLANALQYNNDPRSLVANAIGGSGHNVIIGNSADNTLYGGTGGGNIITGGGGNDTIDGGPGGNNTAVYSGARSSYQITELANGSLQISDLRTGSPDGTDLVTEVQNFQFADATYTVAQLGLPGATLSVGNVAASPNQSIAASSLVSVTQTVAPIVTYEFEDMTAGSGHFVVNGAAQGADQAVDVAAANLSEASFQAGNGGTDDLWVRASDGLVWSQWQEFHVSAVDQPPVVTAANVTATKGQAFAASALFGASEPDQGESIIDYQFWDSTADPQSGYFTVNGVAQNANQTIDVPAAELAQTTFQSASGADLLWVRASDGILWSGWQSFTVTAPIDHAPAVTANNVGVPLNMNIPVASLFTASDPDQGDTFVKYQFWDSATDPQSGHFVVDGVAQGSNQAIDVAASDLGQAFFLSPSAPDSDLLWVRASDGVLWSNWQSFTITAPAVLLPQVSASNVVLAKNTETAVGNLFTAAVPYTQTAVTEYELWQTPVSGSGSYFIVDGVVQAANTVVDVAAADLSNAYYQAGSDTVDQLWVRGNAGQGWGAWTPFTVAAPNHAPVVAVSNLTATHGQSFAASALFSATDPDGDTVASYQLWETATDLSSGFFTVNGVVQGLDQAITLTPGQLAQTAFQSGSGSVLLWVRATDGQDWSSWQRLTVSAPIDHAPTASASDLTVAKNTSLLASTLFTATPSDPSFSIVDYQFWDSTGDPSAGQFMVGGVAQGANHIIDVPAASLAQASFQAGTGISDLWVRVNDGVMWSAWAEFHVTGQDRAPVVTIPNSNVIATKGETFAASALFSAVDPDAGDTIQYQLWDSTSDPTSGDFEVSGVAQGANQTINLTAAQLAQTSFQSGSGADLLWVRATDGQLWSGWQSFTVTAPIDHAPVIGGGNASLTLGQSVQASALFTVSDPDQGDTIVGYQFWESTSNPQGGHFAVNGVAQGNDQAINVAAARLSQTTFTAATAAGSDQLWVRASDGVMWSDWHPMTATSHA